MDLMESFYQVNAGPYDRNKEFCYMQITRKKMNITNGGSLSYGSGGAPDNLPLDDELELHGHSS